MLHPGGGKVHSHRSKHASLSVATRGVAPEEDFVDVSHVTAGSVQPSYSRKASLKGPLNVCLTLRRSVKYPHPYPMKSLASKHNLHNSMKSLNPRSAFTEIQITKVLTSLKCIAFRNNRYVFQVINFGSRFQLYWVNFYLCHEKYSLALISLHA